MDTCEELLRKTPATTLGFLLPAGPITKPDPELSEEAQEKRLADYIRQKALVNVDELTNLLTERAINPDASAKILTDAIDINYKLSGMAAKSQAREMASMGAFQLVINLGGGVETFSGVTIEQPTTENLPDADV